MYGSGGFMRYADSALFKGESVLIPRKGTLNNVRYVNEAFWTVDTMFYAVPKVRGAAKYAFEFLRSLNLALMDSGSAVPSMTTKILNALNVPVPSASNLLALDVQLEPLFEAQRMCDRESKCLSSLRDTLLPKLMSGEIDVSKVDLTQLNSHLGQFSAVFKIKDWTVKIVARPVVGIHLGILPEKLLHTRLEASNELSQIEINLPSSLPGCN